MGIRTSANKYRESSKDSWKSSQSGPKPSTSRPIKTTVVLPSFGTDAFTSGLYSKHPHSSQPISGVAGKQKLVASTSYQTPTKLA